MDKLWVGYEQFEKSQAAACLAVASLRNDPLVEFGAGLGNSSLPGQSCLSGEADVRAHAAVCPWQSSIQGTAAGGRRYLSTCQSRSSRFKLCAAFTLAGQFVVRKLLELAFVMLGKLWVAVKQALAL